MTKLAAIQLDFAYWKFPEFNGVRYAATPWEEHLKICENYHDGQSPERLSQRGGFGVREAVREYGWEHPVVWIAGDKYPETDEGWKKIYLQYDSDYDSFSIIDSKS